MNKSAFDIFPNFETERLNIRPFTKEDFDDFVNWHDCADIIYYNAGLYGFKKDNIEGFQRFFLQVVPRMFKTKESGIWCVAEKSSDINIGLIEVCKYDAYSNTAQIHYCMSQAERCKGYMTEAVKCMLEWAFSEVDLNRIYTYVLKENGASARVLEKCGFTLEGVMRKSSANEFTRSGERIKETKKDSRFASEKEYRDNCIYGLLRDEYFN